MEETLPEAQAMQHAFVYISQVVHWTEKNGDSYSGPCIDTCTVQGLADNLSNSQKGELNIRNDSGGECTFKIVADHACPIPNDQYILLGTTMNMFHGPLNIWVIGKADAPEGKFRKLSVIHMADGQEAQRLKKLHVYRKIKTFLL